MEVNFKPSDVVWVKLGPFWWPGEVVDRNEVPDEVIEHLKKDPIAVVKFFDGGQFFECVKTANCIHPYNCERKYDFIKKGMDAFRAKNPKMASFPKDVCTAEVKTGGNANILSDPMFSPERKRNYAAEIFGSPAPKKQKDNIKGKQKQSGSKPVITHRRFLGYDDYEARVLILSPEENNESETERPITEPEKSGKFICPICHYVTDRLGILMKHVKWLGHMTGPPPKKPKEKRKRKKTASDEETPNDDKKTKAKRKYKKKAVQDTSSSVVGEKSNDVSTNDISEQTPKLNEEDELPQVLQQKKLDICNDIIADWNDDTYLDSTEETDTSFLDSTFNTTSVAANSILEPIEDVISEEKIESQKKDETPSEENKEKDQSISCFDFAEEEEVTRIPSANPGRKIPRVIPISDKRKSFSFDEENNEEEQNQILQKSDESPKSADDTLVVSSEKETEELEKTYQMLMESTSTIELPEIPSSTKSEQNFHCAKTVKYPDKPVEGSSEVIVPEIVDRIEEKNDESTPELSEKIEVATIAPVDELDKSLSDESKSSPTKSVSSGKSRKSRSKKIWDETVLDNLMAIYRLEHEDDEVEDASSADDDLQKGLSESNKSEEKDVNVSIPEVVVPLETPVEAPIEAESLQETLVEVPMITVEENVGGMVEIGDAAEVSIETAVVVDVEATPVSDVGETETVEISETAPVTIEETEMVEIVEPAPVNIEETAIVEIGEPAPVNIEEIAIVEISESAPVSIEQTSIVDIEEAPAVVIEESPALDVGETTTVEQESVVLNIEEATTELKTIDAEEINVIDVEIKTEAKNYFRRSTKRQKVKNMEQVSTRRLRSKDVEEDRLLAQSNEEICEEVNDEPKAKRERKDDKQENVPKETENAEEKDIQIPAVRRRSTRLDRKSPVDEAQTITVDPQKSSKVIDLPHTEQEISTSTSNTKEMVEDLRKDASLPSQEENIKEPAEDKQETINEEKNSSKSYKSSRRRSGSQRKSTGDSKKLKESVVKESKEDHVPKISKKSDSSKKQDDKSSPKVKVEEKNTINRKEDRNLSHRSSRTERSSKKERRKSPERDTVRSSSRSEMKSSDQNSSKSDTSLDMTQRVTMEDDYLSSKRSSRSGGRSSRDSNKQDSNNSKNTRVEHEAKIKIQNEVPNLEHDHEVVPLSQKDDSHHKKREKSSRNDHKTQEKQISKRDSVEKNDQGSSKSEKKKSTDRSTSRGHDKSSHRSSRSSKSSHSEKESKTDSSSNLSDKKKTSNQSAKNELKTKKREETEEKPHSSSRRSRERSAKIDEEAKEKKTELSPVFFRKETEGFSHRSYGRSRKQQKIQESESKLQESAQKLEESTSENNDNEKKEVDTFIDVEQVETVLRTSKETQDKLKQDKTEAELDVKNIEIDKINKEITENAEISDKSIDVMSKKQPSPVVEKPVRKNRKSRWNRTLSEEKREAEELSSKESDKIVIEEVVQVETINLDAEKSQVEIVTENVDLSTVEVGTEVVEVDNAGVEIETVGVEIETVAFEIETSEVELRTKEEDLPVQDSSLLEVETSRVEPDCVPAEASNVEVDGESVPANGETAPNVEMNATTSLEIDVGREELNEPHKEDEINPETDGDKVKDLEASSSLDRKCDIDVTSSSVEDEPKQIDVEPCQVGTEICENSVELPREEAAKQEINSFNFENATKTCEDTKTAYSSTSYEPHTSTSVELKETEVLNSGTSYGTVSKASVEFSEIEVAYSDALCKSQSSVDFKETEVAHSGTSYEPHCETSVDFKETEADNDKDIFVDVETIPEVPRVKQVKKIVPPENKSPRSRKPSRWDQIERPQNLETKLNEKMKDEMADQSDITLEHTDLNLDESSQKEMENIFSNQDPISAIDLKKAAQIELIFGSSPLPKLCEDSLFNIEKKAETQKQSSAEVSPLKSNENLTITEDKYPPSTKPQFDAVSDSVMESVESQVARITHYEEPNTSEKVEEQPINQSDLDSNASENTEEQKPKSIFDTPEGKRTVESSSPESRKQYTQKSKNRLMDLNVSHLKPDPEENAVASKKNYLLVEKSKLEKMTEKSQIPTNELKSSVEKVATKLTNPKKRFVKSFEDSELIRQKELSTDPGKSTQEKKEDEEVNADSDGTKSSAKPPSTSGIVGKSPIVFKLKKQFLSKINSIFEEENDDVKSKLPPLSKIKESISKSDIVIKSATSVQAEKNDPEINKTEKKTPSNEELEVSPDKSLSQVNCELGTDTNSEIEKIIDENRKPETSHEIQVVADKSSPVEFTINTNLSNIGNTETLSELCSLVNQQQSDKEQQIDDSETKIITKNFPLESKKEDSEFVAVDGNLTVVSEKDLAEGQVEITASMPNKKPVTLLNFSMDFSDDSCDASFEAFKKEKLDGITESLDISKNIEEEVVETNKIENKHFPEVEIQGSGLENAIAAQLGQEDKTEIRIDEQNTHTESETIKKEPKANEKDKLQMADLFSILSDPIPSTKKPATPTMNDSRNFNKAETSVTTKAKESDLISKMKITKSPINEPVVIYNSAKNSTITDMCDLEDHIPSQIVCTKNALINENVMKAAGMNKPKDAPLVSVSKLFSRLSADKPKEDSKIEVDQKKEVDLKTLKLDTNATKTLIKAAIKSKTISPVTSTISKSGNKAIILSEKIIRPARDSGSAKRVMTKKDEKPTILVPKSLVTTKSAINISGKQLTTLATKQIGSKAISGKAKILNQTIIRPAGEVFQTKVVKTVEDNNTEFDINSMPIVLSDGLLTAESLENMPIVLGDNIQKSSPNSENLKLILERKLPQNEKILTKTLTMPQGLNSPTVRTPHLKKTLSSSSKMIQTPGLTQKIIRQPSQILTSTKGEKYIVLPESSTKTTQILKKPNTIRKQVIPTTGVSSTVATETSGHKIMILTNQQGQQQRLLLTPAQQKMFGMQLPKTTKAIIKGTTTQKMLSNKTLVSIPSTLASTSKLQSISSPKLMKTPATASQIISSQIKLTAPKKTQKVYTPGSHLPKPPAQKTILIKNQHGQTVRKIQGTDDALLDKQVAEQLEAIKVSSLRAQQKQQELATKGSIIGKSMTLTNKKPVTKKSEIKQTFNQIKTPITISSKLPESNVIPPLSPLKLDKKTDEVPKMAETKSADRPLNQLVIRDNLGNLTTITEGQILALPSETVDGQAQTYMLVTLDESGNLTPLNNEALMSLDPSLADLTGGDLSNMVLQMDPSGPKDGVNQTAQLQAISPVTASAPEVIKAGEVTSTLTTQQEAFPKTEQLPQQVEQGTAHVQVTCNVNGEPGQQLILTGDPVATQKFLDSLSEGNTDLANILANAEGNSFIIQADGQQILINTEPTETHMSTSVVETDPGNPMFPTHPVKNQDILAAALADTDVFQQDQIANQSKLLHSQLSPGLFPMNVAGVLETSLTLNSPIMTPLEVPSTNTKRIPDGEANILTTHVPKNVDLPITITDPNITQTVSHQQVLMASELQANLELTLPISETAMSVTSEMNSPSFVYSLPNLDVAEHTEISQKSFSSSMPLLTEDIEESNAFISKENNKEEPSVLDRIESGKTLEEFPSNKQEEIKERLVESFPTRGSRVVSSDGTFMEGGLCTLGGEMCSSLSEPPPEMFDIPISSDSMHFMSKSSQNGKKKMCESDENSTEIPVQSELAPDLNDSSDKKPV